MQNSVHPFEQCIKKLRDYWAGHRATLDGNGTECNSIVYTLLLCRIHNQHACTVKIFVALKQGTTVTLHCLKSIFTWAEMRVIRCPVFVAFF